MKPIDIITMIIFAANAILPFILDTSVSKWVNGMGWGAACIFFYVAIRHVWFYAERELIKQTTAKLKRDYAASPEDLFEKRRGNDRTTTSRI